MTASVAKSAAPEMAVEQMILDKDFFRIEFPRELSPQSIEDMEGYINNFLQRLRRRVK